MSTAVVEISALDDVTDSGGESCLQDTAGSLIDPTRIEALLSDQNTCIKQTPSGTEKSHQDECKDFFIDDVAAPDSSYNCEWTTTRLRLPSPLPASNDDSQQEHFLCLPINVDENTPTNELFENTTYEESKGYVDEDLNLFHKLRHAALNKYLSSIPSLSQHKMFDKSVPVKYNNGSPHHLITAVNSGRVINVLQGEIANCTPSQADVLVSDDATTCHIVALRSICRNKLGKDAILATMAHVDGAGYEACLRDAVLEHAKYHSRDGHSEECTESSIGHNSHQQIDISIHMMGGFNDPDGSSIKITDDILQVFSRLAREFDEMAHPSIALNNSIKMKLETCLVSGANDDGTGSPIGRGLGMNVVTGEVFLAEVEENINVVNKTGSDLISLDGDLHLLTNNQQMLVEGPESLLRSVRLWAAAFHPFKQEHKLIVIHRHDHNCLTIEPFMFGPHPSAKFICYMDDTNLLQMTSTSPLVEKPNFAAKVRESLEFMNRTNTREIFEDMNGVYQPIEFHRVGLNGWVRKSKEK
jgi:protein N-terminal asparagine amidohydrolase